MDRKYPCFLNRPNVLGIIGHDKLLAKHAQFYCVIMLLQKMLTPKMKFVVFHRFEHANKHVKA